MSAYQPQSGPISGPTSHVRKSPCYKVKLPTSRLTTFLDSVKAVGVQQDDNPQPRYRVNRAARHAVWLVALLVSLLLVANSNMPPPVSAGAQRAIPMSASNVGSGPQAHQAIALRAAIAITAGTK